MELAWCEGHYKTFGVPKKNMQQPPHGKQQKIQEGSMHVKYIEKESLTSMTRCLGHWEGVTRGVHNKKKEGEGKSNTHHERIHMNNKDDDGHW